MEKNKTQGGFWMLIEEFNPENIDENISAQREENDESTDNYEFFPDASF